MWSAIADDLQISFMPMRLFAPLFYFTKYWSLVSNSPQVINALGNGVALNKPQPFVETDVEHHIYYFHSFSQCVNVLSVVQTTQTKERFAETGNHARKVLKCSLPSPPSFSTDTAKEGIILQGCTENDAFFGYFCWIVGCQEICLPN